MADGMPNPERRVRRIPAALALGLAAAAAAGIGYALSRPHAAPAPAPKPPSATTPPLAPTPVPTTAPTAPIVGFGIAVADDPASGEVVIFGGVDSYDTTWLWQGDRWILARPSTTPPGRFAAAAAYNPALRMVMLYGGRLAPGQLAIDTWGWNGSTWRELDAGGSGPPPGEGPLMTWDARRQEMVLVAGPDAAGLTETWVWQQSHWQRAPKGDLPFAPFGAALGYDPITTTVLLVNGSTRQWDGTAWHVLPTRTKISGLPVIGVAVDASVNALILCEAPTVPPLGPRFWQWSGTDWVGPTTGPPISVDAEVSELGGYDTVLVLGSPQPPSDGQPERIHVWAWTGQQWLLLDGAPT